MLKKYRLEMAGALFCVMSSLLISTLFMPEPLSEWYLSLQKPSFSPPSYVFGPVWTTLYILMGIALGRLCYQPKKHQVLLKLFGLQFTLNLLWSPIFFYCQRIDLAFIEMSLLWSVLVCFMYKARGDQWIVMLMSPYLLWLSFAWFINLNLLLLNA